MSSEEVKRKLTAILSADVQGYSRLMGDDERATVETITAYRKVMTDLIQTHHGSVKDAKGDNVLAEFPSVVDAIQCAVEIQKTLEVRNADLPENRRMAFRIGVNLGDVIEKEDTIYGDGVNIAARLESLAEGGGICISGTAFDQVGKKLPLGYKYLGEQKVKNIEKPVRSYKVLVDPESVGKVIGEKHRLKMWHWTAIFGLIVLIVVAGGLTFWEFYFKPDVAPASIEKMAYPLPDKPSIAVLPFENMSGDPDQEFFSDGLSEEIITALSKVTQLFVIDRNSSFSYKGKAVKVKQIAEDLGVRYVLEGSVRKEGDRVRITAQLIDAITGHQLWAERYDKKLKDIFSLQDEITMKILTALQLKLTDGEIARISARGTRNLEAYLKVLQARGPFYTITKEGFAQARRLSEEALAIDPNYAAAYLYLGSTHFMDVILGSSKSPKESLKLAFEALTKAKKLDDSYAAAYSALGFIYVMKKQYDKGMAECERAVALEPNSAIALIWMSLVLTLSGNHQEAVQPAEKSLRLNPMAPPFHNRILGMAYAWVGRYEDAISAYKKALRRTPNDIVTHIKLTNAYSWAGRMEEAKAQAQEVLRINPKYCIEKDRIPSLFKNQADRARYAEGLRKAGLPETPPLPLPDKPSIAVLPFVNISNDKSQEIFSDGLTEEIITSLSKAPQLFVIASNTSFTYKGKPVNVRKVSKELGVQYVIEGSVRKEGDRIRVTAQMIDALKDHHIWAERYDKEFKDIFSIQDDITKKIITAVHVKLTEGERARVFAKGTSNLQAYLKAVQADWFVNQATRDSVLRAEKLAEESISLDPNYAYAHMVLGSVQIYYLFLGMSQSPKDTLMSALREYKKAVALDPKSGEAHALLAYALVMARQYDQAAAECDKAMVLAPNSYKPLYHIASALAFLGRREEAIAIFRDALRINPEPPNSLYRHFGVACRDSGRYDEAIKLSKKATERNPNDIIAYVVLASSYGLAGRDEEARAAVKEILRINPKFSVDRLERVSPHKDRSVAKRFCDALRKAGLK
jgi:adenylate cyclase